MIKSISENMGANKHSLRRSIKESLIFLLVAFLIGLLVGLSIRNDSVLLSEDNPTKNDSFVGKLDGGEVTI